MRPTIAILCMLVTLEAGPVRAHSEPTDPVHVVGVGEVWKSLGEAPDAGAAQRAQILRVLEHPATREIARTHGLDLNAAEDAVRVLDADQLQELSARAALAESGLSTSDKVVLSTTTLIIILLILIILLLVA